MAFRALISRRKKGVVLIVASVAGLGGGYGCPMYCATKHAMVGLVRSLALAEDQEGVKVVGICPGYVCSIHWFYFLFSRLAGVSYSNPDINVMGSTPFPPSPNTNSLNMRDSLTVKLSDL